MNYDFTLLSIGYAQHNGDWNFEHICSSFTRIYWVTEGCGEVTLAGHTHRLTPGNLYLIPALASHSDHSNSRFCHYYLHFLDASMQIYEFYQQYRLPFCIPATEVDQRIIRYLLTQAPDLALQDSDPATYETTTKMLRVVKSFQNRPKAAQMEINGLLHVLFAHFAANAELRTAISDQRIINVLWTINNDLAHVPSLNELANEACLNKNSFIRQFRRQTGSTPTDYIIHRRIIRAQLLFINGSRSIKTVAHDVGYDNPSYFARTFKRIVGITPIDFIRQNR